jgi:hypothetical protein
MPPERLLDRLHDAAPFEIQFFSQLHGIEDDPAGAPAPPSTRIASRLSRWRVQAAIIASTSSSCLYPPCGLLAPWCSTARLG